MSECHIAADGSGLSDAEWRRYGRQLLLPELGEAGQQRLRNARVLLVGLGGLGSASALYLAAAGVGELWLCDGDTVEVSNLQRQIIYGGEQLAQPKNRAAAKRLVALNPAVRCHSVPALDETNHWQLLAPAGRPVDLVLDGSDNMATRQRLNRACVELQIPLLTAAATGWQGQLALLDHRQSHGPCYHCLYPDEQEPARNCRTAGILGPVVGMMGVMQALEAIKFLAEIPGQTNGVLHRFDGLAGRWQTLQLVADPACPVCAGRANQGQVE